MICQHSVSEMDVASVADGMCPLCLAAETVRLRTALEQIAVLDEADGHELKLDDAFKAVAIATTALGKHPSQIERKR